MSVRARNKPLFDVLTTAFSILSGAAAGLKVSAWQRMAQVDTFNLNLSTTGTVAGTWSIQAASDSNGSDAVTLDPKFIRDPATGLPLALPVAAGAPLGPTLYQIVVPDSKYNHFRVSFNLTGGAGNDVADIGLITSIPLDVSRMGKAAIWVVTPATSTHAGQPSCDFAPFYYTDKDPLNPTPPTQANGFPDIPQYALAVNPDNTALTIAAVVSGITTIVKRLGLLEVASIRMKYLPTSGFGRIVGYLNTSEPG